MSKNRKFFLRFIKLATFLSALSLGLVTLFITIYIFYRGIGGIDLKFLTSSPSYLLNRIGILPNILNTIYMVCLTLLFAIVPGVATAIYLNEYSVNKKFIKLVSFSADVLAAIPSIIYGLVGMLVFVQFMHLRTSILSGALTLSIMSLPLIIRTTSESLKAVPNSYREGAFALGAGRWVTVTKVVLPSAIEGIKAGVVLSIGKILGESAALLFTAGLANVIYKLPEAVINPGATLSVALYVYAKERGEFQSAFAIAFVLIVFVLILHILLLFIREKDA